MTPEIQSAEKGQKDVSLLSDEELNERIGTILGWSHIWKRDDGKMRGYRNGNTDNNIEWLPNWCHDQNAMHEAEKIIGDPKLLLNYHGNLFRALIDSHCKGIRCHPIHATARQRAAAFVLTMSASSVPEASVTVSATGVSPKEIDIMQTKLPKPTAAQALCEHEAWQGLNPRPRHCVTCGLLMWDAGD